MQGGHGLQKPELETVRKEDLYIRAVRIVARDGGLGPAGEGGLNGKIQFRCALERVLLLSDILRMLPTCNEGRSSALQILGSVVLSDSTNETSSFASTYFRGRRVCD